jgi:hypothetical protein
VTILSARARYQACIDPEVQRRIQCSSYGSHRPFAPNGKSDCQYDGTYKNSDEADRGNASDDPKHDDDEGTRRTSDASRDFPSWGSSMAT